jgi:ketosteroid isomerase-like protein
MKKSLSILIVLIFPEIITGQDISTPFISIMKAEFEAFQKKDPSLWIKYVRDDAVFAGTDNNYKTKEQIAEEMTNAPDIFASGIETYENVLTRIFDNTAILSCFSTFSLKTQDGRTESLKFKFIRVHIRDDEEWKLVYHSAVPVE